MDMNSDDEKIKILRQVAEKIVRWYKENARLLPWREEGTPYAIWISEIMLQQTRIEAVKPYYRRFLEKLPTIADLANVEEEKLLKLWEGLGYYNRARNLQKAARKMMENYGGEMPKRYEELVKLPGIGEYTAGAIASIAYQEKVPAVDGNVLRVMARILGSRKNILLPETKKEMNHLLREIMPDDAGDFNEGIMELGELVCLPNGIPDCEKCPIKEFCIARSENLVEEIPIREKKEKRRVEKRTIFLLICQDTVAIRKRPKQGLLAGMYEFPNVEGHWTEEEIESYQAEWNLNFLRKEELGDATHIFSHIEWKMKGYEVEVAEKNDDFLWVKKSELENFYALPSAFSFYKKKLMK